MPVTTNTRKLAALLGASGGGIHTDGTLQTAAIKDGAVTAVKAAADVATQAELDAVEVDFTPLRQDITVLALREAVTENRVALNFPNSFIDQFQDDSGIGTETDTDRDAGEHVETTLSAGSFGADTQFRTTQLEDHKLLDGTGVNLSTNMNASPVNSSELIDGQEQAGGYGTYAASPSSYNVGFGYNVHETTGFSTNNFQLTRVRFWNVNTSGRMKDFKIGVSTATSSPASASFTAPTLTATDNASGSGTNVTASNANEWSGASFTAAACNYWRIQFSGHYNNGNANAGVGEIEFWGKTRDLIPAATGTMIGNANVPSSAQTKVSGVMLYKDATGTATISTSGDLRIYFTCNGGTNWTQAASYTAVTPVFSTGIKMVKLGETTCTSGSDVRYKAVWANQGTAKITQLHGIGLNY